MKVALKKIYQKFDKIDFFRYNNYVALKKKSFSHKIGVRAET